MAADQERKRILVADDDPTVRQVLRLMLELEGYEVSVARDGYETLFILPRARPHVVLLDLAMPGASGLEVCRRIKETHEPPSVIVVSAGGSPGEEAGAMSAGADAYLHKPFAPPELLERLADLLDDPSEGAEDPG